MSEISTISTVPKDTVILFESEDEIEKFIKLYEDEGGVSREDTVDCLAHFIWSLGDIQGATLCFSTWSMNHGDPDQGENIRFFKEDGMIIGETVVDIKVGDELLNDYRDFEPLPSFWTQFCEGEGVKDVMTNLKEAVELY